MNYKRLLTTLAALLFCGSLAFGEIALKDLGNGQVEITFTFKDASSEMGVIGSFDNWTVPGEVMTKNDAGLWEKTIQAGNADVITYKFYSKGTWIFDERAPDKKDDGYGGFNGLIPVADILAGVLPAVPGAAPLPPPKGGAKVAGRPKLAFGTTTYIESTSTFATNDAPDLTSAGLTSKSIWRLQGDLVAGMPGYLEVTAFNGAPKVYAKNGIEVDEGLEALSAGFVFNPVYYLGGNKRPTLDKFRFGFDTPYLTYETGYGSTPLPLHQGVLWPLVSNLYKVADAPGTIHGVIESETEVAGTLKAADGYSAFLLGPKAKTAGDFTFDAGLVPNKSVAGAYGFYSWASVEAYGFKVEGMFNHKASTSTDVSQYFVNPSRQDLILGIEAVLEGFLFRGQSLSSSFAKDSSGDLLPAKEKSAYKVVFGYQDYYGDTQVLFGYATRGGVGAQLLYLTPDDMDTILGVKGTQTLSLSGFQKFGYWGVAKWEAAAVLQNLQAAASNIATSVRPGLVLDFGKMEMFPVAVEGFANLLSNTKPDAGQDSFRLTGFGAKVSVKDLDVYLKADNTVKNNLFNTVLTEAKLPQDLTLQGGFGLRSGTAAATAAAFVLGASYTLSAPEAKSPAVYAQLAYNMDPYNGSGNLTYDLTDFGPTNGVAGSDGQATLRLGIRWNY